jgi:hypothetical protein
MASPSPTRSVMASRDGVRPRFARPRTISRALELHLVSRWAVLSDATGSEGSFGSALKLKAFSRL